MVVKEYKDKEQDPFYYGGLKYMYTVLDIALQDQNHDFDHCFCIDGAERLGKSHLLLHALEYLGFEEVDVEQFICLQTKNFFQALYKQKKKGVVAFDEAGDGMFSRDAMRMDNKNFVKAYQAIGGKNLITFLVLPSFFRLDRYFREDRVSGLFHVYKRGGYVFFSKPHIKRFIQLNKMYMPPFNSPKRKYYPKYKGKLLEKYKALKEEKMQSILKEMQPSHLDKLSEKILKLHNTRDKHGNRMTQADIAAEVGCSRKTVNLRLNKALEATT